ncbi:MAG: 3-methyl-2-oxobutanoate hydroxymethyltransferase [Planctomycetota bacterium]
MDGSTLNGGTPTDTPRQAVTLRTLRGMAARGEPFACLTAYDATTARWLERGGVHVLLAGDSAAQVVLGFERTVDMPLDFAIQMTAAVKRGAPGTVIMADMPFMSYHASADEAMTNAGRFVREGLADVVKLEADASFAPIVERMTRAGIPVCAHIGFRPQATAIEGVPTAAGRTQDAADLIVEDAVRLERAGAVLLLIEAVPPEVTRRVLQATSVPLIGIGAGTDCHGQILVVQDLLGMSDRPPRFAEPVASLGEAVQSAGAEWVQRVATGTIGGQTYRMRDEASPPAFPHSGASGTPAAGDPNNASVASTAEPKG